ncbi:hypothetical protein DACRYDRAFT_53536 [Dacryopinax primogenitus]|uniref:Large ribosomal subunit protein mL43 n=1 Tax=Dacryopinax primogenitus (strain DJM 731) TaxID=1858805 RepID=M5FTK5_DACPD|nr:uncharacterized protein DACRYDRAFT_53536 [Dacryopinax primogenitus]EJU00981.1 hypothetical protein DACRYDRAFT_53536 [Dacryopinax primogenitus]
MPLPKPLSPSKLAKELASPSRHQVVRASLVSRPGHAVYIPQIRKLVFEYCDVWISNIHARTYLLNHVAKLAAAHPHVEVVVQQRSNHHPIARGLYLNGRDKVIALNGLQPTAIAEKVNLLLDSSGAKIKPLKKPVESTTESVRGIWSGMHVENPVVI